MYQLYGYDIKMNHLLVEIIIYIEVLELLCSAEDGTHDLLHTGKHSITELQPQLLEEESDFVSYVKS